MSFQTGLSGLNAASRNLDVIGNNIANSNTVGMKSSRVEFAELLATSIGIGGGSSGGGIGVEVATTSQQFSQGNINITGNDLDLAINGGGFFQLLQADGTSAYTRNGAFKLNNLGNIVTNTGAYLMGYPTTISGTPTSTTIQPLVLPTSAPIGAKQTTAITAEFNLDARVDYPVSVGGVTASYTTAAVTPFNYSTIAGTPATYTTSPIASAFYGVAATPQLDGTSSVITHSAAINFSQPFVPQVDGSNTQTITNVAGSNAQAGATDAGMTGNYTGGGVGPLSFTVDVIPVNLSADYTGNRAGFITDVQAALGAGYVVTDLGLGLGFSIARATTSATQAVAISAANPNAVTAGIANSAGTGTFNATAYDFSGAGLAQFNVDTIPVTLTAPYTDDAGLAAAIAADLGAGYTVTVAGPAAIQISKNGSLLPVAITGADLNAVAAGFANSAGTGGTAAIPAGALSFLVDGTAVNLAGSYANTAALAAAITGQLTGYTATINEGSDTIELTKTGSLAAVVISANTAASANEQANAVTAGFVASAGVAGTPAQPAIPALVTITPPGGTAFNVSLSGTLAGAADLAAAIQASAGYAASGFTVAATPNDNNPGSTLVFTDGDNTAANFVFGGADAAVITAGTPVAVAGVADNTSNNASFTAVGPGGTAITVNLTGNITGAADLAAAIQGATGYASSGFTVAVGGAGELVFTATSPDTTGDILISNPTADPESGALITALGGAGSTVTTGVTPTVTGTIIPRTTYGTSLTAYDSQGVALPVSLYFTKVPPTTPGTDEWAVYDSPTGSTVGSLVFDATGALISSTVASLTLTPAPPSIVPPFPVTVDFSQVTQYGAGFAVSDLIQDGYASGELVGMKIGEDGIITARYSNGETQAAGQVALADFRNVQGLSPTGGGSWIETFASGQPVQGAPGQGRFGGLRAGALEESNVDLTAELVNMMTAQRAYQANAQTIKTQDQVLQTLVNLR